MADGKVKILTDLSTEGFKKGISSLGSIAKAGIKTVTTSFAAIGAAVAGVGAYATKVGSDFEAGMSEVSAISGATEEDLSALTAKAKEMGSTTKFSATESAEALKYMAMAGWDTQAMLDGLPGIMNLAAASGEELGAVSDILTDSMTAFGLAADQSAHFADVLAKASSSSNTNVGLMGETFKYVAPVAGALGFSVEDTATAIGLMANAGIKGSQAGTALRGMFSRLAKPSKETAEAMDALGISLTNADGSMKSLDALMGDLRESFSGLSEAEKAEMASSIAGQEAMSGLLAIVNASDEDFNKLKTSIYNADGAAEQMAATMNDNLQGAVTIAKSALEGLGISVYESIQEPLKDAVKLGTEYLGQLQDAFNDGGIAGAIGALGDILADAISKIAEKAPELIDIAVDFISAFCEGLLNAPGIADAATGIITSLVNGISTASDWLFSTAIQLIGSLAEGLAAGAPKMVKSISDAITDIVETIIYNLPVVLDAGSNIILSLIEGLGELLPTLVSQGADIISILAKGIATALPKLVPAAVKALVGFAQALIDNLPLILDAALQLIQGLADGLLAAIPVLIEALPALIQGIIDFLIEGIPMLIQAAIQLIEGIVAALPTIIQALIDALPQIIESLVSGLIGCIGQLVAGAIQLVVALVTHLPEIIVGLIEAIPQIIEAIIDGFMNGLGSFTEAGSTIIDAMWDGIKAVWDTIVEWFTVCIPELIDNIGKWFSELPDKVTRWFSQLFENVKAWGSSMWAKAKEIGKQFIDGLVNFIKTLPQNVWNWLQNVIGKVTSFASTFGQKALEAGKTFLNNIVNIVKQIPGKMLEIGKNIVSGIWNGISSAASWLWDKISGWCSSIFDGIKGFFGIHSPSRLMADQVGHFLPLGIAEGFDKAMPEAQRDIESGLDDLVEDMTPPVIPIDILAKVRDKGVLRDIQSAVDASAASVTINARARAENDPGKAPAPEAIDYDKLAEAVRSAPIHTEVKIGEKAIVDIVSPGVNRNMGAKSVLEKRYA